MFDENISRNEIRSALQRRDHEALKRLFRVPPVNPVQGPDPRSAQSVTIKVHDQDWTSTIRCFLDACYAAESGDAIECYEHQSALQTNFNQVFGSSTGNWLVPALHSISKDTHRIAVAADRVNGQDQSKLENAASLLQESFSRTYNDRKELVPDAPLDEEGSKKIGVLGIVNELFKIYFRLNTLRLCKNLVKPVEARNLHKQGSMGQLVTYKFFVGRLELFEDHYPEAEKSLEFAFRYAHRNAIGNKKRILRYLIPVKMHQGRFPSPELLDRYELYEFAPIVEAIRKGDLRSFNDALIKFQDRFIRQGTYLLLEKCKIICYRNLFKRVHFVLGTHHIPLDQVANAFKWLGIDMDLDEIECILANLIFRGVVRGYIAHMKKILVLSKRDPFPLDKVIK